MSFVVFVVCYFLCQWFCFFLELINMHDKHQPCNLNIYAYTSSSSINSGIAWWMESFGNPRVRLQLEVSPDTTPDYMMWDCGNFFLLLKLLNVWHNRWNFGLRWRAPCQRITRQGRWHLLADYYEVLGSRYAGTGVQHDDTISLLAIDVSLRCAKCFLCSSLGPGGGYHV